MIWITAKGNVLLQRNRAPVSLITDGFCLSGGQRLYESAEYYEITNSGEVLTKYGKPEAIHLEDQLIVSCIHLVVEDTLYHFYWCRMRGEDPSIQVDKRLRKLRSYPGVLPFDPDAAISAYEQAVVKLIEDQSYKPPPSIIVADTAGNTFRLFETTMAHKHTKTATGYDPYMCEETTYSYSVKDYYRLYLAVPSGWYHNHVFAELVENRIQEAICRHWLKDAYQQENESLDFMELCLSNPKTIENTEANKTRFYRFGPDFRCEDMCQQDYEKFLESLRALAETE